ncbi:hypothetical protein [Neobacillus cucumis]|uniref:hypothetical protein n=1 Tax=Neobacillus cucumis TaxID=1740721 RepID=UPI00196278B5|nr:hypothetical protein [Neobacillus cucumis]MBM7652069.1 hypothetical protein [Neobacillus cucumis]
MDKKIHTFPFSVYEPPFHEQEKSKFGQLKLEITQCCPKSRQDWTAQARNHAVLSEVMPSSDSSSHISCSAVRSHAKFGQLKPDITRRCPKSCPVRTAQARNHAELSEVTPSSDSSSQNSCGDVRR